MKILRFLLGVAAFVALWMAIMVAEGADTVVNVTINNTQAPQRTALRTYNPSIAAVAPAYYGVVPLGRDYSYPCRGGARRWALTAFPTLTP